MSHQPHNLSDIPFMVASMSMVILVSSPIASIRKPFCHYFERDIHSSDLSNIKLCITSYTDICVSSLRSLSLHCIFHNSTSRYALSFFSTFKVFAYSDKTGIFLSVLTAYRLNASVTT